MNILKFLAFLIIGLLLSVIVVPAVIIFLLTCLGALAVELVKHFFKK